MFYPRRVEMKKKRFEEELALGIQKYGQKMILCQAGNLSLFITVQRFRVQGSKFRVHSSALPLAAEAASLIEKETFVALWDNP